MNISLLEKYSKVWYNIADKQVHLEKRFSDDEDEIEEVIDNPTQSVSAPTRH